jgi:uracil-DNA glycosylase family 4
VPPQSEQQLKEALAARVKFARELGLGDMYRQRVANVGTAEATQHHEVAADAVVREEITPTGGSQLTIINDRAAALDAIRADLGDCTRCVLHKLGRKQIVFHTGNPHADIMFIGEAPGADEDEQGVPFVGRAGQLLTNMIQAMGIKREDVYIANIIKCRPPGNRTPEREECETCSPFLLRQIEVVQPKIIVALGAVAARTLLGVNEPMMKLRGQIFDFRGTKLAVTYHPAYLLRDPRQKAETWKDLQMVMQYLGMKAPAKSPS